MQTEHRTVLTQSEIGKEFIFLANKMGELITLAKPWFEKGGARALDQTQKLWFGEQLIDEATGLTLGFLIFSVTNNKIFDKSKDYNSPDVSYEDLTYSLHLKQNENQYLANMFAATSIMFRDRWGEPIPANMMFRTNLDNGPENNILIRDLIRKTMPQVTAFTPNDESLVSRSFVYGVGVLKSR